MNFRDRVQDIIAGQAHPANEAFEGFAGLRPGRVSGNACGNEPEQVDLCDPGDTFLELFKRRSEYQFFCEKKSLSHVSDPTDANSETRLGQEPSKPSKVRPLIPPEQIRTAVEREVRALEAKGRIGPEAIRDAIEITRAKARNSEALSEHQVDSNLCHVCGQRNDDTEPVVAVMTGKPNTVLHMHAGCHDTHRQRMQEKVDAVMEAAGYGRSEG